MGGVEAGATHSGALKTQRLGPGVVSTLDTPALGSEGQRGAITKQEEPPSMLGAVWTPGLSGGSPWNRPLPQAPLCVQLQGWGLRGPFTGNLRLGKQTGGCPGDKAQPLASAQGVPLLFSCFLSPSLKSNGLY